MSNSFKVRPEDLKDCLNYRPKTIETASGMIEYGDRGEGPVILSIHGGPGGFDQGLGMADMFRKAGYRIIAPSRPGYLGTPLETGRSKEKQADMLANLLDALDIQEAAVIGASAGGFSTYELARRHPDRVSVLMEIDAVNLHYTKAQELSPMQEKIYLSKMGIRVATFFADHFPSVIVKNILSTESTLKGEDLNIRLREILGDENKKAFVNFMVKTMSLKYDHRKEGVDNDLEVLEGIDKLPLSNIKCPTLLLHGTADADVPFSNAEYGHENISDSVLYPLEGGSHLGYWTGRTAYEAQEFAIDWLKDNYGGKVRKDNLF